MCQSVADGGLRCAAHTRRPYLTATAGTPAWDQAAAHFAATPTGEQELRREADLAAADGNLHREIALRTALDAGARLRAVSADTKTLLKTREPAHRHTSTATPAEPLPDLEDLARNLRDPAWVANWNATPVDQRTPIRLVHGTPNSDSDFAGMVHFGDPRTAMDRLANTVGEEATSYLISVDWTGDLHPAVPDTVANYVAHQENAPHWRDSFYDRMTQECEDEGVDENEAITSADDFLTTHPEGGLAYINNTEGDGDEPAISLVFNADHCHLANRQVHQVTDEDWYRHYGD